MLSGSMNLSKQLMWQRHLQVQFGEPPQVVTFGSDGPGEDNNQVQDQ